MPALKPMTAIALILTTAHVPAAAQAISQQEAAALRAEIAALKAQINRLEARIGGGDSAAVMAATQGGTPAPPPLAAATEPAPPAQTPTAVRWKGGPVFSQGEMTFHPKGRIQYDAGLLMTPDSVADRARGYSNELRRLRLGGEGRIGGGFGYKLELELSDNSVDLVDSFITYEKGPWLVTLGNHNGFQSLDELISDTGGAVMERAAFTDAFNFERRLGLSVQYRKGIVLAQAGLFSDSADSLTNDADGADGGDENNSYSLDGRIVLAPKWGDTQLHVAASGHWRDFQRLSSVGQRYRQRAYLHSANSRFLATPQIVGKSESHYGLEFAGERGPFWWASEAHWLRVSQAGVADPLFFGGYGEVGYVLTGEQRGYKNGIFGTVTPDSPVGSGGWGALQATLRYDYLDLNDKGIVGGTQKAVIAAMVWTPVDFLRFNVNYAHLRFGDAAILAGDDRDYSVDVIGWRAELDF
ncbi:hypothetical protein LL253_02040 [Sphingobium soli]|uniref:Porin n=2 Tax=Sphingobium soli TaxID=1591116 RepID=A0ABS8H2W4_9SPHN|nr:hypothetical protein [Sphingobium soli]